ncbi:MAG: glycosyltransferase [Pseudomonadota bacterium]|nr:glycosyltransferase [Pseudomonadota bacterium]
MKICLISTTAFSLPPSGYAGTEEIVYRLALEYQKAGHQVSVVAPEGSTLPDGIELIPTAVMESEESAYEKYKDRLPEWDIIHDHSFGSWVYQSSIGIDPPLPIVKTHHTDPSIWSSAPPVPHPCLVGLSRSHARNLAQAYGINVEHLYNGISLEVYTPPPAPAEGQAAYKRNGRLLFLGRYTPEKNPLGAMQLAKRLKIPLDCYGDTRIVSDPAYVDRCRQEADGIIVRMFPGVSREKTVELYRTYRALLHPHQWTEPFGLVLAEAQACGMPVLTLDLGAAREVVSHEKTGYVCQDLNEIEQVLKSGCLSSIKAEDCVAWAQQFSVANMAAGYLRLFERVRAGHSW